MSEIKTERRIKMECSDIKRLGLILSIRAEIEGMKAENQACGIYNETPTHNREDFKFKSEELRNAVQCPEELL